MPTLKLVFGNTPIVNFVATFNTANIHIKTTQ